MAHLGQLPEVGSLPTKLVQDAAVEALLLRAAAAQLGDVGVVQTGPVLRERLGTVALYLPATHTHTHTHTDTHTHGHTHMYTGTNGLNVIYTCTAGWCSGTASLLTFPVALPAFTHLRSQCVFLCERTICMTGVFVFVCACVFVCGCVCVSICVCLRMCM